MIPVTITQTIEFDSGEATHEKTLKYSVICQTSEELFSFAESMENLQNQIHEHLRADADAFWDVVKKTKEVVGRLAAYEDTGYSPEDLNGTIIVRPGEFGSAMISHNGKKYRWGIERLLEILVADTEGRLKIVPERT